MSGNRGAVGFLLASHATVGWQLLKDDKRMVPRVRVTDFLSYTLVPQYAIRC